MYYILTRLALFVALVIAVFPIYWIIITSFKNDSEINRTVATFFPQRITVSGYQDLIKHKFFRSLGNSFTVAIVVACFTLLLALPASFALARLRFPASKVISSSFLFAYMLPAAVMYLPMFILLSRLELSNTLLGLMVIYPTLTIPYATWILVPYLMTIPKELEESGMVDGASRIQTLAFVILPLALPGIMTTFIFCFTMCWSEYLYALVNISSSKLKTYSLVLTGLIKGDLYPWNEIMAGGVIACMPVVIIYIVCSRFLISGLTAGAVKG